jgi:hypothetical protein
MTDPTGFWFSTRPQIKFADLNKVQLSSEEQELIILLLRNIDETEYKGRLLFRDSILDKYMSTMNSTSD